LRKKLKTIFYIFYVPCFNKLARYLQQTSVSLHLKYFDMEQLLPQQVWSNLSGYQADSDGTQYNARVVKDVEYLTIYQKDYGMKEDQCW